MSRKKRRDRTAKDIIRHTMYSVKKLILGFVSCLNIKRGKLCIKKSVKMPINIVGKLDKLDLIIHTFSTHTELKNLNSLHL